MKQITKQQYDELPDWAKVDYEVNPEKWMPDVDNNHLWYLQGDGEPCKDTVITDHYFKYVLAGNGYTTKEKAEQAEAILRPIRRVVQYLVENDVDVDRRDFFVNGSQHISIDLILNAKIARKAIDLLDKGIL